MKYPSTYKFLTAEHYDQLLYESPIVDADFVTIEDHLPYYLDDPTLTKEQKREKYVGQNMYLENCSNPKDTYFVYSCYFNIEHPGTKLYWYGFPEAPKMETVYPIEKKYKFICLQSKPRMHRVLTSSWINENFNNEEYFYTVNFNAEQDGITAHLEFIDPIYPGLAKHFIEGNDIANELSNEKFYRLFYSYASSAVFNIITEPEFFAYGYHHSEKTDQAFLSYNIPIVHGYSACDSIKKIGFDMFEDIIDYSSQYIKDPFKRTFKLLNDNKEILKNAFDIPNQSIRERLEYNNRLIRSKDINKGLINKLNDESVIETYKEIMYNTSNKEIKEYLQNIL